MKNKQLIYPSTSDDSGHYLKGERHTDHPPILWMYSKVFNKEYGIPTELCYPINKGVTLTVMEFIEFELGFSRMWEQLDLDKKVGDKPFARKAVFVRDDGYMIYVDTSWLNESSQDSRALELLDKIKKLSDIDDLSKESAMASVHIAKHTNKTGSTYLYVNDIILYTPSPYLRDDKTFNKLMNTLNAYMSVNDTDTKNHCNNAKIHMLVKEDYDMYFQDFDVSKFTPVLEHPDVFYGDGFGDYNKQLLSKLEDERKGVVLFHGSPGTGKTHYIRHLLKELTVLEKRVIYIPPTLVEAMTDPGLVSFLTTNIIEEERDTILLIEDAEPLLESREDQGGIRTTGISNLLNSTDGLLNDVLGLVVICTFNTELKNIDKALLRPGRLLARKEFKKIKKENIGKAAEILGINIDSEDIPSESYSIAELINLKKEKAVLLHDHEETRRTIGFGQ
jgi:hypothetical protein